MSRIDGAYAQVGKCVIDLGDLGEKQVIDLALDIESELVTDFDPDHSQEWSNLGLKQIFESAQFLAESAPPCSVKIIEEASSKSILLNLGHCPYFLLQKQGKGFEQSAEGHDFIYAQPVALENGCGHQLIALNRQSRKLELRSSDGSLLSQHEPIH